MARKSEATLMAEMFCAAKAAGVHMELEVHVPSSLHRSGSMRADGGVIVNNRLVALVEAKRPGKGCSVGGRQHEAYAEIEDIYGIKTHWVNAPEQIPGIVNELVQLRETLH
jgi:hypothetical protein